MATAAVIQAQLDAVNAAILRLLGGFSEAEFNGRRYREHDLDKLTRFRAGLEEELARIDAGGLRVRQVVPNG